MRCTICRQDVPEFDEQAKTHVVISKNSKDGHVHVHGNLEAKENVKEMLEIAAEESGVALDHASSNAVNALPKEIVFHNRQRIGDMLVFTCGVRDFKAAFPHVRVNVISTAGHIFDHNPNIDRTLVATEANTVKIGPGKLTNSSNRLDWHFCNAFRVSMEEALKVHIPQGESRPDIYLTQEEYDAPRPFAHPYWLICTNGEKGWGTKMYPHVKWQEVIDQNPDIIFVQIGTAEDNAPRLVGPNVIDHIGKTQSKENGIRDLFKLFLNAEGSIGLVSFHMHLSGGLSKPAVVVAGAREPVHFTRYPGHAYLATDGMLPCATKACWHCAIDACTNLVQKENQDGALEKIPKCVDIISAADVTRAIQGYYQGGRLIKGIASPKPKLKNIVPTPEKKVSIEIPTPTNAPALFTSENEKYGMPFGGGSLTDRDWEFIKNVIDKYAVKDVLEFGAGLSTLLLNDYVRNPGRQGWVFTYESKQGWIDRILVGNSFADIHLWDGVDDRVVMPGPFDLAFVDGPAGDQPRHLSTKLAAERASIVIVHDAGREWARKYQELYLTPGFDGPFKGGHRCHLWVKKGIKSTQRPESPQKAQVVAKEAIVPCRAITALAKAIVGVADSKFIKIVSTARGWGGCARSVTTIMKMLLKAGHKVEFIPFRNAVTSSEWKAMLAGELAQIKVTADYSTLRESCDVLLVYADDYIWEFTQGEIQDAFENIGADRKIMMLNYRRGKVGQVEWTKGWDKYMFLNSTQEKELLSVLPGVATKVLPPCADLEPFFAVQPDYEGDLRLVRHSSQGDTKFPKNAMEEITAVMESRLDLQIHMLPGPSFVPSLGRFQKYPRTADPVVIAQFLAKGNCFWYSVPEGYMDMGPRVIIEAMAAGLPVIADNWGGATDRVIDTVTGVLCSAKEDHIKAIKQATSKDLKRHGSLGRQRAYEEFRPEAWLTELLEDSRAQLLSTK